MREMKDSGVEWIGYIPTLWTVQRIKTLPDSSIENSYVDGDWIESSDISDEGIRYLTTGNIGDGRYKDQGNGYITLDTFKRLNCKYAYPGDLVISRLNAPYGRSCILPDDFPEYVLAVDNVILRPSAEKRFLCYVSQCEGYQYSVEDQAKGTTMKRISRTNLGNIVLPMPPKDEQERIADYLDSKCSKIDEIIAKQEQIIEKLKEYKLSVITEAVTKGLDPDVEMKDSGLYWMGKIPKHWSTPKIQYIAEISSGGTANRNVPEYWNGGIKWLKTGELQNNYIYDSEEKITELALKESSTKLFPENTVLIAMYGQGKTRGMTGLIKVPCTTNQACAGIVVNTDRMDTEFLWESLKGAYNVLRELALGSGQPNLSGALISDFYVTMPPIDEQRRIIDVVRRKTERIENIVRNKEEQLEKLQEYKKSLIYEVVTGKKEV